MCEALLRSFVDPIACPRAGGDLSSASPRLRDDEGWFAFRGPAPHGLMRGHLPRLERTLAPYFFKCKLFVKQSIFVRG